jgi:hypothetical protein
MARHFANERRWLAALREYSRQTREPLPALPVRLGLAPALTEGNDVVQTRGELQVLDG